MNFAKTILPSLLVLISLKLSAQIVLNTPGINSQLFVGESVHQPLIVGLGGSEGGNAWASDYWKATRDEFLKRGYAFLALGYFGAKGTPDTLDRIAIDGVYNAIIMATENALIDKNKIAIVGGSRGGDLALLLGSYYPEITCVVAIVPSHVSFPGHTNHFSTSCWSFQGKALPFVPVSEAAVEPLIQGDLRTTFEVMLKDTLAEQKALIQVEKINGAVLLLSAKKDEIAPTTMMAEKMMARLESHKFRYPHEHIAFEGGHTEPLKHFDLIFEFLEKYYLKK